MNATRKDWLACAALVAMTVLAYLPVWNAGFIWDDPLWIINNDLLRSFDGLYQIWFEPGSFPQYYPLTLSVLWLMHQLWGLEPLGYHLVNVLLHAGSAVLLWRVLRRLDVRGALLAGFIFALHPVQVESVAWATEIKNVLSTLLFLAAVWSYFQCVGWQGGDKVENADDVPKVAPRYSWYGLSLLLFVGALLSKTVTCSLPAVLAVMLWWKHRLTIRQWVLLAPMFVLGVGMGLVTALMERTHVGAKGASWDLSFAERCLIAGRALWFYAGKLLWPHPLNFNYERWHIDAGAAWQWLFPVAVVGVVVTLWAMRKRIGRGPLAAVLIFAGVLFPALGFFNVYPMRYSFVADHFQYLASLGLITLFASLLATYARQQLQAVALVLMTVLCLLTFRHALVYENLETLWVDVLEKNPDSALANNNMGVLELDAGYIEKAAPYFERALATFPDFYEAHVNMAKVLEYRGDLRGAVKYLNRAIEIDPEEPGAYNNMGTLLSERDDVERALPWFEKALPLAKQKRVDQGDIRKNLGAALGKLGRPKEALVHLLVAAQLRQDDPEVWLAISYCFGDLGQLENSLKAARQAMLVAPEGPLQAQAERQIGKLQQILSAQP